MKVFGGDLSQTQSLFSRLQEAKKFSRNPGHFMCVTRESRYHVWIRGNLNKKSLQPSCRIIPKIQGHAENPLLQREQKHFANIAGKKSLYYRGRKLIDLLTGEA